MTYGSKLSVDEDHVVVCAPAEKRDRTNEEEEEEDEFDPELKQPVIKTIQKAALNCRHH